jgi:glucans biosynthesis protein
MDKKGQKALRIGGIPPALSSFPPETPADWHFLLQSKIQALSTALTMTLRSASLTIPAGSTAATENTPDNLRRRRFLATLAGSVALSAMMPYALRAQETTPETQPAPAAPAEPVVETPEFPPFSFDALSEEMRAAAGESWHEAQKIDGPLASLDYDSYQRIRFRPDHARWQDEGQEFRLHAFHLGWLFKEPVHIYEIVDGRAQPMEFSTHDFEYGGNVSEQIPEDTPMPGVAGFRLHNPLNRADIFDELIAFLGASYFRALGRGNVYGLSARGLAVNTAMNGGEEFPRFTDFWLERPVPGAATIVVYAALDSKSVTGAYRFAITPGATTEMEVTARLFLREKTDQIGIAPLTSMYLFGGADPRGFDDFRASVHDSEYLVLNTRGGETFLRALNNPPRLASSYLGAENPLSFGLVQRSRDFGDYLDAQAHYERRPSLMVEPIGDWGKGTVRLVEIPSKLEGNDNIVAFWVPEGKMEKGTALEYAYRLHWGMAPEGDRSVDRARILRTRVGEGGVAGVEQKSDTRKFVIDFVGGTLSSLPADAELLPQVTIGRGEIKQAIVSKVSDTDIWRLVIEAKADPGSVAELKAALTGYDQTLTETWLYQWVRE